MEQTQDWVFEIDGAGLVVVRVIADDLGGFTLVRYSVEGGVSQAFTGIKVASQAEAKRIVEDKIRSLLGPT